VTQLELNLWGRSLPAVLDAAEKQRAAAAWRAQFARDWWVAPYDTAGGMRKGDRVLGWTCPDCGDIEPNEFGLGNNHGWYPDQPGSQPHGGEATASGCAARTPRTRTASCAGRCAARCWKGRCCERLLRHRHPPVHLPGVRTDVAAHRPCPADPVLTSAFYAWPWYNG